MIHINRAMAAGRGDGGFTIVEMMVALVILTVGLLPLFGILGTGMSGVQRGRVTTVASQLAQEEIEAVRMMDYGDIGNVGGTPSGTIPLTGTVIKNGVTYTLTKTITWVDDPSDGTGSADTMNQDYKELRVVVTWAEPKPGGSVDMGTFFRPYTGWNHSPIVSAPTCTPAYPPAVGGYIKDTVTLMATATDDDGTITQVQFLYKVSGAATWTGIGSTNTMNGSYYTVDWNTAGLNGNYLIMAKAWDNNGAEDSTYANVVIDNSFPTAVIQPATSVITDGASPIAIVGTANDPVTVAFDSYYIQYATGAFTTWRPLTCAYASHAGYVHGPPTVTGVNNDILAAWPVMLLADGEYQLRMSVTDKVNHLTQTNQTLTLNIPPPKPVLIRSATGGRHLEWDNDTYNGAPYSFPADFYSFAVFSRTSSFSPSWTYFTTSYSMPMLSTSAPLTITEYGTLQFRVVAYDTQSPANWSASEVNNP